MSPTYLLGLVFAIIILVMVFVKMRNSGLKERYGLWWCCIAFFTALLSLFPPILKWTAFQLGVVVPLNLGFFLAGVMLLLLSLRFSVDLSRSDEDHRATEKRRDRSKSITPARKKQWTCRARMRTAVASPRRLRSCAFK